MALQETNGGKAAATEVKNIVLVHGAFTDGSCWAKVIPPLQQKAYNVVAVQNPMISLADEVSATKRSIALQDGPIILAGHSQCQPSDERDPPSLRPARPNNPSREQSFALQPA